MASTGQAKKAQQKARRLKPQGEAPAIIEAPSPEAPGVNEAPMKPPWAGIGQCVHCGAVIDKKDNCCRPCFDKGASQAPSPFHCLRPTHPQGCNTKGCELATSPPEPPRSPRYYLIRNTVLSDPGPGWTGMKGDFSKREKLQRIAGSLNHTMEGLGGKVNLGDMVRYGLTGPTFTEIGKAIGTQPGMHAR